MKTVLVTGAAGFIGSNLTQALLEQGYRVVGVDNFDDTYNPAFKEEHIAPFLTNPNFALHRIDIRDLLALRAVFEIEKPSLVAHLAGKADTRDAVKNPEVYLSVNMDGTLNILELAREFAVENMAIASSGSVYGNNPNIPWQEDENTNFPLSAYGVTKKAVEMLAYTYHHNFNMNVSCLRYFNVYGENNRPSMVPYKWGMAFLLGEEIELSGEGVRQRDFTYVGDVVSGTILALTKPLGFEVLNISNSSPTSLNELISVFEKVTGKTVSIRKRESHNASVNEMFADNSKAKKLLGWEPQVSLEEGITRLIGWLRANRLEKS
jgi:nucleoside-diphosphate-sugar epimerase